MGFTRESHPLVVLFCAYAWSAFLGYISGYRGETLAWGFAIGFCLYTFTEYFIHRVLFHVVSPVMAWPKRLYYKVHGRHHQYPNEYTRVALPLLHQYLLVVIMICVYRILMIPFPFASWKVTFLIGSGMMSGYGLYEVAHLHAHGHPVVSWMHFLDVAKEYHQSHHHVSSKRAYGFCSPFWDLICNSLPSNPHLNPFFGRPYNTLSSILAALPLPIPFYHWIMIYFREKNFPAEAAAAKKELSSHAAKITE